jgi:hypothetical protein
MFERVFLSLILQDLLVRKEKISLVNLRLRRRFRSFCTSPSCQILSNALSMSRKTPTVHSPRLECLVVGLKFYKGVVSGALCTKVKLFGGKKIVSFECEFEAIVKILSKILPVMLRSEMER